jgi:hypothetical protein
MTERTYENTYNDRRARKGDYLRFRNDYKWYAPMREVVNRRRDDRPTERVLIPSGTVVKVVWSGKSHDKAIRGATKWRIGVVWPGREKPLFLNQQFYGSMEFVTKSDYEAQVTA